MKKLFTILMVALLALTATSVFAAAPDPDEGWTLGVVDGPVNPINGSAEYPAAELFYETFEYDVSGSDASPDMPGYIGPANVCDFASGRPCTNTAKVLNLHFSLEYAYSNLVLDYARYGSEADLIRFDGVLKDTVSATENGWNQFLIDLGSAKKGSHTISIVYAGGGEGNGHYIDAITLVPGEVAQIDVVIDIKPGSDPNAFNINDHGVIPVAIFGSEYFDVSEIDLETVTFAGMAVRVKGKGPKCALEYVDDDGYMDLVCQFEDDVSTWEPGEGTATLEGYLYDGTYFYGSDTIKVVPE